MRGPFDRARPWRLLLRMAVLLAIPLSFCDGHGRFAGAGRGALQRTAPRWCSPAGRRDMLVLFSTGVSGEGLSALGVDGALGADEAGAAAAAGEEGVPCPLIVSSADAAAESAGGAAAAMDDARQEELRAGLEVAMGRKLSGSALQIALQLEAGQCALSSAEWRGIMAMACEGRRADVAVRAFARLVDRGDRQLSYKQLRKLLRCIMDGGSLLPSAVADRATGSLLRAALDDLRSGDARVLHHMAMDARVRRGDLVGAEDVFYALKGHESCRPNAVSYCILVKGFGRLRQRRKLHQLLSGLSEEPFAADLPLMNAIADALVRNGELGRAKKLLDGMEKGSGGLKPDHVTYNTVLRGLAECGDADAIRDVVSRMRAAGEGPDENTADSILSGLRRRQRTYGAEGGAEDLLSLLPELRSLGVAAPSDSGFSSIIAAAADAGDADAAGRALAMLHQSGSKGNAIAYTGFMKALLRAGRTEQAKAVLDFMETADSAALRPTAVTYNVLLKEARIDLDIAQRRPQSAAEEPNASGAADALEEPIAPGAADSPEGPGAPGAGARPRDPSEYVAFAQNVLDRMRRRGGDCAPTTVSYNILLDALASCEPPRMREAERVLSGLQREVAVEPDRVTYATLIKGYGRNGEADKARAVLEAASRSRARQDAEVRNSFLRALVRCDDLKGAVAYLDAWIAEGGDGGDGAAVRPNLMSYSVVIFALARHENALAPKKAMVLYWKMRDLGVEPDDTLCDVVLSMAAGAASGVVGKRWGGMAARGADGDSVSAVLMDLKELGWPAWRIKQRKERVRALLPFFSESWKEGGAEGPDEAAGGRRDGDAEGDRLKGIFMKHGWNSMDSGFRAL